jgi:hypothetical protein
MKLLAYLLAATTVLGVGKPSASAAQPGSTTPTWSSRLPGDNTRRLASITYATDLGLWVAVGNVVGLSTNGIHWEFLPLTGGELNFVMRAKGQFIAAGATSDPDQPAAVLVSNDGRNWTPTTRGLPPGRLMGGTYNGTWMWLVGRAGLVVQSSNGLFWDARNGGQPLPQHDLFGVTYGTVGGQHRLVAVGADGAIWYGPGGAWTQAASGSTRTLHGVTWGQGRFVAVGDQVILQSTDGVNWTPATTPASGTLRHVSYQARQFMAVGDQGTLLRSLDGLRWERVPLDTPALDLRGVEHSGRTFVAVATDGGVVQSGPVLGLEAPFGWVGHRLGGRPEWTGLATLAVRLEPGADYDLQSSGDLIAWGTPRLARQRSLLGQDLEYLVDLDSGAQSNRFYRLSVK